MPRGGQLSGGYAGQVITADLNIYVRLDGNNANDGLENTAARALRTIQAAVDRAASIINLLGYQIKINVANGTYLEHVILKSFLGSQQITIIGQGENSIFESSMGWNEVVLARNVAGPGWRLESLRLHPFTYQDSTIRITHSVLDLVAITWSGSVATAIIVAETNSVVEISGNHTFVGGGTAPTWIMASTSSTVNVSSCNCALGGNIYRFDYFVYATASVIYAKQFSYSGSCVGYRYVAIKNGVIDVAERGTLIFPGTLAGVTNTGGQYA